MSIERLTVGSPERYSFEPHINVADWVQEY
jgi:hypothetical protein